MPVEKISEGVFSVGVVDWDRRVFDELIPIPEGTSYNSYLVKGSDKVALLDTVDPPKADEFFSNLKEAGVEKIDYIISHHAEQDHSGSIPEVLERYPNVLVVTNAKCKGLLQDLLLIPDEKFMVIGDGDELELGGKTLKFFLTPWVHWPETMISYLKEDKILFTCDFFGSHVASNRLFVSDDPMEKALIYWGAKRYYAEIMMPFRTSIKKHIKLVESLDVRMIAPSHGLVYDDPSFIIDAYKDWISDDVKNEVVIPYISAHGSVKRMVSYVVSKLTESGVTVKPFNLSVADVGEIAMAMVDAATLVVGSSTILANPHPMIIYVSAFANALRPKTKFVSIIGSYGWGTRIVEQITDMIKAMKVEVIEPVVAKGYPKEDDFRNLDRLVADIINKHKEIGIL